MLSPWMNMHHALTALIPWNNIRIGDWIARKALPRPAFPHKEWRQHSSLVILLIGEETFRLVSLFLTAFFQFILPVFDCIISWTTLFIKILVFCALLDCHFLTFLLISKYVGFIIVTPELLVPQIPYFLTFTKYLGCVILCS